MRIAYLPIPLVENLTQQLNGAVDLRYVRLLDPFIRGPFGTIYILGDISSLQELCAMM